MAGRTCFLVNGLINDCGRIVREGTPSMNWFDMSTLKEPYRLEGKKTMGLELAEQLGWKLPGVILYPTGGGTGLIGMWKAFAELSELGWLQVAAIAQARELPECRLCSDRSRFRKGRAVCRNLPQRAHAASGLRVPAAVGDFMMLDAIRASRGFACAAREEAILPWMKRVASLEGISVCPETAVCFACLEEMLAKKMIDRDEEIVVFNTGASQKYTDIVTLDLPEIDKDKAVDYARMN